MNILLSSIGSRGDVQPLLALALELRELGHNARLCVAPNFKDWVESFGLKCHPIGPDLERLTATSVTASPKRKPSAEQMRQFAAHTVRENFPVLMAAARGCDVIVAGGALQIATRSVAEMLRIPYVFVTYCPTVLPSPDHPPPKIATHHLLSLPEETNCALWSEEEEQWNDLFRDAVNDERGKAELMPITSVQEHVFTDQPWLAADPIIAPVARSAHLNTVQTGAWFLPQPNPLPEAVDAFLGEGDTPVYFGFGSMRASDQTSRILIETARLLGLRSIVSKGWGNLASIDSGTDVLVVDDVAHDHLFPRVAAVVHHGGAGTTTAAALAGRSQVVIPHLYDQFYWARRVQELGIGVALCDRDALSLEGLVSALRYALYPEMVARSGALAPSIYTDGAHSAARRIISTFG